MSRSDASSPRRAPLAESARRTDKAQALQEAPTAEEALPVEVRRSRRRRRTVAAYREEGRIVVLIPARMSRAEERRWVASMVERLQRQEQRRRPTQTSLERRARELSRRYLDGAARPISVRWVDNQRSRWGSCTPSDGTIRLSSRLQGMPEWVIDYVLLHELAHLVEAGHGKRFWSLLESYPRTERARGFLEGVSAASGLDLAPDDGDVADDVNGADDISPAEHRGAH